MDIKNLKSPRRLRVTVSASVDPDLYKATILLLEKKGVKWSRFLDFSMEEFLKECEREKKRKS